MRGGYSSRAPEATSAVKWRTAWEGNPLLRSKQRAPFALCVASTLQTLPRQFLGSPKSLLHTPPVPRTQA